MTLEETISNLCQTTIFGRADIVNAIDSVQWRRMEEKLPLIPAEIIARMLRPAAQMATALGYPFVAALVAVADVIEIPADFFNVSHQLTADEEQAALERFRPLEGE
jgi:hypothetical protein